MAKKALALTETETIIAAGVKLKGTLLSEGDISIDAELKGSIKTGGNLTIGVNAMIEGNVSAQNVKVGGNLIGNIKCEGETQIEGSGKVKGNINTVLLSIDHGGLFIGQSIVPEAHTPEPEIEQEP